MANQTAANRLKEIANYDVDAARTQAQRQIENYDLANEQNRALRDLQLKQLRRDTESDRFNAQRQLRNATLGLLGSMGPTAFNSSSIGNVMSMLRDRNDADNTAYWDQLQQNFNQVNNAYEESVNANQVAKNDVLANLEKAQKDINSALSANLNNIDESYYVSPYGSSIDSGAGQNPAQSNTSPNYAQLAGYLMPENAEQNVRPLRNRMRTNDYFSRLINSYNRR